MEILQGNRSRDAGEVSVLGTVPATGTRAWRSRVGIVRRDESAPVELTVRETVRHVTRSSPRPRDPEQVVGPVGLEDKPGSRVKALSGGQRRRPDVPTTGFDPAARRRFWDLIRLLADRLAVGSSASRG